MKTNGVTKIRMGIRFVLILRGPFNLSINDIDALENVGLLIVACLNSQRDHERDSRVQK